MYVKRVIYSSHIIFYTYALIQVRFQRRTNKNNIIAFGLLQKVCCAAAMLPPPTPLLSIAFYTVKTKNSVSFRVLIPSIPNPF